MKIFKLSNRNRLDLYHVCVPLVMATVMAPQALSGSAVFLLAWVALRNVSNV